MSATDLPTDAARIVISGLVQGIGMRPSIARLADEMSLNGFVANTATGVEVHVQGRSKDVDSFKEKLPSHFPPHARVSSIEFSAVEPAESSRFVVKQEFETFRSATAQDPVEPLAAAVPADRVVCQECLDEIQDPANRRYRYPFTSCTHCGPRYSLIRQMPFERATTGMESFELCGDCQLENEAAKNRRFHCQTNACPKCGPRVWIRNANDSRIADGEKALEVTVRAIHDGQIVALRGVGGYQLLADATSDSAIERLRKRKQRKSKPLAVMVETLEYALEFAELSDAEKQLLTSPAGPIVIVGSRPDTCLSEFIHYGLSTIGLMLPTTPLHWMLLNSLQKPVVCTSGNLDGEPMVYQFSEAIEQLGSLADVWLEHDRPIERPVDDSVVREVFGRPMMIRLARGFVPLSLPLTTDAAITAFGGHQKTSLAISNGLQSILGSHLGDMDSVAGRDRSLEQESALQELMWSKSSHAVCDLHPDFFTTAVAHQRVAGQSENLSQVQHHHAHIAAGMLEQGWLDRKVLGVAFDGTGFAEDGTIWGGEFLVVTVDGYERVGCIRPFSLAGGELAIRQPWRVAVALVRDSVDEKELMTLGFPATAVEPILAVLQRPGLSPITSSAGRLFDGMAALILGIQECDYEGEAAIHLESACDLTSAGTYDFPVCNAKPLELDWRPVVRQVLRDRLSSVPPGTMAMRFHRGLAQAIVEFGQRYPALPVVLGGGVFQNRVLVELVAKGFAKSGQAVGLPGLIPTNDGGLAAGQLAIAASLLKKRKAE